MGNYVRHAGPQKFRLQVTADKLIGVTGPVTITFDYKIRGVQSETARFELTAPETNPVSAVIKSDADGGITIKGTRFFEGKWAKQ